MNAEEIIQSIETSSCGFNDRMKWCFFYLKTFASGSEEHKTIRASLAEYAINIIIKEWLKTNNISNQCKLEHSLLLVKSNGHTTELDFLLITPYRVFVIEVKSYYGGITVTDNGEFSVKTSQNKPPFLSNPLKQNCGHCINIYDVLKPVLPNGNPDYIQSIIVLFSDSLLLDKRKNKANVQKYPICFFYQLTDVLSNCCYQPVLDVQRINAVIKKHSKPNTKDAMAQHIAQVKGYGR